MKFTSLLFVVALVAVVVALFAWAVAAFKNASQPHRQKRMVIGNASRRWFRRNFRKVYLTPLLIARVFHLMGLDRLFKWLFPQPSGVQFCNVGEGTRAHGIRPYIPDAATASRYLLYKIGSDGDHCAVCGAGDIPLGSSDDLADTNALDVPIAIKLFGACEGTVRIVTDGTLVNGSKVTTGAAGVGTLAVTTNIVIGVALIGTDTTSAANDVIEMIPNLPLKAPF